MKILKNLLIIFAVLIVLAVVGLYIFVKTLDVNKYKPQITAELKKALGREVELGNIDVQLTMKPGILVELKDLEIAEDPQFDKDSFIKIKTIKGDVDLEAYLKSKTINVASVSIEDLQINVIRNESGVFNYQGIIDHITLAQNPASAGNTPVAGSGSSASMSMSGLPILIVRTFDLVDGMVHYQDKMPATAMNFSLNNIDAKVKNFSLDQPFIIETALAVFSTEQNIQGNGQVRLDLTRQSIVMNRLNVKSDLAKLSPDLLKKGIAALAPVNFDGGLKGQVSASIDELKAGSVGLTTLKANLQLTDGEMKLKEIFSPFTQMTAEADINETDLMVKIFSAGFASGKITAQGRVDDYLKTQRPSFKIDLNQVQLALVVDPALLPAKVEGKISFQLSGEAQGIAPEKLKSSLTGKGQFAMMEGKIIDINILKTILDKMAALPAIGGVDAGEAVMNQLPESYKDRLKLKDTIIDDCQTALQIANGAVQFNDFNIHSSGVRVGLSGQIDLDQNLELNAQAALDQALSASIVSSQDAFSYLLNENKEIAIPLTPYHGKLAQLKIFPDFKDFLKNALVNRGKQELRNVIFKALDLEQKPVQPTDQMSNPNGDNSAAPAGSTDSTQSDDLTPEQKAIDNLLNKIPIFGK